MILTAIKSNRRKRRFDLFFDGELLLSVCEDIVYKFGMHRSMEIDDARFEEIARAQEMFDARQLAVNFISYRPRSAGEVKARLKRKGFREDVIRETVDVLVRTRQVDDTAFARAYVSDLLRKKPVGAVFLRLKLEQKGVPRPLAEQVVRDAAPAGQEAERAREAVRKKLRTVGRGFSSLERQKQYRRLYDFLIRRGFSSECASETLRSMLP